jgi:hypothetical protein
LEGLKSDPAIVEGAFLIVAGGAELDQNLLEADQGVEQLAVVRGDQHHSALGLSHLMTSFADVTRLPYTVYVSFGRFPVENLPTVFHWKTLHSRRCILRLSVTR